MWNKTKPRLAGKTFLQTLFFFLFVTQICFAQWYLQNSGTTAKLNSVHFEDSNNGCIVGENGTIIHTTNGGQEWITQTSGTSKHLNGVWFSDLNTGWIAGDSGKILKTSNGGQEWIEQTSGTNLHLNAMCFTDMNKGWVVGDGIILHTDDGGTTWVKQSNDTLQPGLNSVCFVDSSTGWAVGGGSILKTFDGGNNWINLIEVNVWDDVSSVFFYDLYKGWISVYGIPAMSREIMYTTNGGIVWFSGNGGCNANSIYFIDANNGWAVGGLSVGCSYYMCKSIDGGVNWIPQLNVTSETLNSIYFTDLNTGWAVGNNGTILHTTNGGVTFIEEEKNDEIPTEFLLSQNYPNPFNSSSVIKYSIPTSSQVTLKIFNTLGEEIETLVDEAKAVGTYEVNWDAANLPSGVYFYRIQIGSFTQTRKMILLK